MSNCEFVLPENESDKWTITKNVQGTIKVSTCEEDETHIYEKTRDWVLLQNECPDDRTFEGDPKKIARFFISDLLNAEKINNFFVCRKIHFMQVFLCGTVVFKYKRDDNYFIQVDDGTSSIRCIISSSNLNELVKSDSGLVLATEWLQNAKETNSDIINAEKIMVSSINHMQKSVPVFDDVELGDVIKLIGHLTEYCNGRYIFIKKITKLSRNSTGFNNYLEDLANLYKKMYDN